MFRSVTTRVAGLVVLIAGLWGGLVPFVGPYFHFALGPNHSWTWTTGRFYLSVLPAIAAVLGGLILLARGPWPSGRVGALLALAGGVWFAIGPTISLLWAPDAYGLPHGPKGTRMLELLTYHTGLGVLIATFAAYALPGVIAVRRTGLATDSAVAGAGTGIGADAGVGAGAGTPTGTAATRPVGRRRFGLFGPRVAREGEPAVGQRETADTRDGGRVAEGTSAAPAREEDTLVQR
jgi:hypothetical protein